MRVVVKIFKTGTTLKMAASLFLTCDQAGGFECDVQLNPAPTGLLVSWGQAHFGLDTSETEPSKPKSLQDRAEEQFGEFALSLSLDPGPPLDTRTLGGNFQGGAVAPLHMYKGKN